jgi:hypothetical protein
MRTINYWLSGLAYRTKWLIVVLMFAVLSTTQLPEIFAQQVTEQFAVVVKRVKRQRVINLNSSGWVITWSIDHNKNSSYTWTSLTWVTSLTGVTSWYSGSWTCIWDMDYMGWTWLQIYSGSFDQTQWTGNWSWFDMDQMMVATSSGILLSQSLIMSGNYLIASWCSRSGGQIMYPGEQEYLSSLIAFSWDFLELPLLFDWVSFMVPWQITQLTWQNVATGELVTSPPANPISHSVSTSYPYHEDVPEQHRRINHLVQSKNDFASRISEWSIILQRQKILRSRDTGKPNRIDILDDVVYDASVVRATIDSGTTIVTAQWQELQANNFVLQVVEQPVVYDKNWSIVIPDSWQETIEFGTPWDHLIFTKPILISYQSDFPDWTPIAISVKHADQDWSTQWLSLSSDSQCDSDGNTDKPWSETSVQSGQIMFYTCGASLFTMNTVWWGAWSNDLRVLIGDYGQMQVYYNGLAQIFGGNPPAAGAWAPSSWPILRVGGVNVGNTATAWNTASTTWSWFDNTYDAVTTLSYITWGLTYSVRMDWQYIAPAKTFTQSYTWTIPTGNTQPIKWYYGMDSFVAGADANDVWYYTGGSNPTAGIYDNVANIFLAQKYISGRMWSWYISSGYATVNTFTLWWTNYPNATTAAAWDLWFWVNWDFGTTPGTYTSVIEWPVRPYVSTGVVDIIPWVWQPQWKLVVWTTSQMPITVNNVGLVSSTGLHQVRLTIPANLSWSSTGFTSNGWSCGAQTGTSVICTKTTSISSTTGDSLMIPVTPLPAASGSTPTFTVVFSGGWDSNLTNNTGTVLTAIPVSLNTLLTNASLWLKANAGTNCSTDGCAISQWNDVWWSNNHARQTTGSAQPVYKINSANFNPVINFNTTTKYMINTTGWTYRTIFAVRNLAWTGQQYLFSAPALSDFSVRSNTAFNGTSNLGYTDGPNSWDWSSGWLLAIDGKTTNVWKTNYHLLRAVSQTGRVNTGYSISTTLWGKGMYGNDNVAEILIYNTWVNAVDTNKIESYLSIKYGLTLDQSVAWWQNYTLSNWSLSWSTGSAASYNNNIAGITRDDDIGLLQAKSQSINDSMDIIVEKTGAFANFRTLTRANDSASTGSWTTAELWTWLLSKSRIARERRFQEKNGDVGSVIVTYPISTWSLSAGTMFLMVDTDGNFANGGTTEYTWSIVSWYWTFTLNIADLDYISFGFKTNGVICITSPTALILSGTVSNTGVVSEYQFDYFSVEDTKSSDSWYYTTISLPSLTTSWSWVFSNALIQWKWDMLTTLTGSANTRVVVATGMQSYATANTAATFIKRDWAANWWLTGLYWSKLRIKVTIPPYQQVGTYTGIITYTLYEN